MSTITREEVKAFIEQIESDLSNGWEAQIFELKLARIALASLDAEPVAYNQVQRDMMKDIIVRKMGENLAGEKLVMDDIHAVTMALIDAGFRAFPPAPVENEFIPKNLDKALGVVGVALPESKEEFNFQTERWIQRLIDRVIRYADEFKEQPAPVVSFYRDGIEAAASWVDKQRQAFDNEHGRYDSDTGAFEFGNDAQRDYSDTLAELADGIRGLHPNAGDNSPVTPDCWIPVSERMPGSQEWVIVFAK